MQAFVGEAGNPLQVVVGPFRGPSRVVRPSKVREVKTVLAQLPKCVESNRPLLDELEKQIEPLQLLERPQKAELHRPMAVQHQPEPLQELTVVDPLYSLQKRKSHTQLLDQRHPKPIDQEARTRKLFDAPQLLVLQAQEETEEIVVMRPRLPARYLFQLPVDLVPQMYQQQMVHKRLEEEPRRCHFVRPLDLLPAARQEPVGAVLHVPLAV